MKFRVAFYTLVVPLIIGTTACGHDRLDVDVSAVQVEPVKIDRLDRELFAIDTSKMDSERERLRLKYGDFWTIYEERLLCVGDPMSAPIPCNVAIKRFLYDTEMRGTFDEIQKLGELTQLEGQLTESFRYFKHYFPQRTLPKAVYAIHGGHNFNFVRGGDVMAISLEFHLGASSKYYEAMRRPKYISVRNTPDYMAAGYVHSWMMIEFPYQAEKNDVLNRMVYEGKLLYLAKALLRETPDTILFGFTQKQLDWCEASEASMWAALIEEKKLFSESEDDIMRLVNEAPFTTGFPRESPGRAGTWIGYRIVKAFMDKNESVSLDALMQINDGQTILTKSKYKPKF